MDKLFVYGTLMRQQSRHHLVADRLKALCPARCEGVLLDMGAYPAMIDAEDPSREGPSWVQGELLLVEDLDSLLPLLDRVEGCAPRGESDGLYRRERVTVQVGTLQHEAWTYLLCEGVRRGPLIPSGAWRARSTGRSQGKPTPLGGLDEVLRMIAWQGEGPGSEGLLPAASEAVVTWGGADLVLADRPPVPPDEDEDPWGRFARCLVVPTPHALALGWLVNELMDRVLWRGLCLDKYSFFGALGQCALDVLVDQPRASEQALMGAMWCRAAELVRACGWMSDEPEE